MKHILSKALFLQKYSERHPAVHKILQNFAALQIVGKPVNIYLFDCNFSFFLANNLRARATTLFHYLAHLVTFVSYSGVCVGKRHAGLSSSIIIRFVSEKVLVERQYKIFSPRFFWVEPTNLTSSVYIPRNSKAKLFFLKAPSQKKLISKLY